MNKFHQEYLFTVVTGLLLGGMAFYYLTGVPEVHKSLTTGECVQVVPISAGSCRSIPSDYDTIWVK